MAYTKELLTLSVEIGKEMLQNGGEIYRVEDHYPYSTSLFHR